jgi:hypothetical protein
MSEIAIRGFHLQVAATGSQHGHGARTGRGINRMFAEQLRVGRPAPDYGRSTDDRVVAVLPGGPANLKLTRWVLEQEQLLGVTRWPLPCVYFALDRKRHLLSLAMAGLTFAVAVLTKVTTALAAPGVVLAIWYATDARTRGTALIVAGATASLVVLYPVYAAIKRELFAGPDHNSLLGTAVWQLHNRTPSGSLLTPGSATQELMGTWTSYDPALLIAGTVAAVAALFVRRLRT